MGSHQICLVLHYFNCTHNYCTINEINIRKTDAAMLFVVLHLFPFKNCCRSNNMSSKITCRMFQLNPASYRTSRLKQKSHHTNLRKCYKHNMKRIMLPNRYWGGPERTGPHPPPWVPLLKNPIIVAVSFPPV